MRTHWFLIFLVIGIAVVGIMGCNSNDAPTSQSPSPGTPQSEPATPNITPPSAELEGTTWVLVSYGNPDAPQAIIEGTRITATFSTEGDAGAGGINGTAGCNSYFGSFETNQADITFGPLASTKMACLNPEGTMDQEIEFLRALGNAVRYLITGDTLQISYDSGVLTFNAE